MRGETEKKKTNGGKVSHCQRFPGLRDCLIRTVGSR